MKKIAFFLEGKCEQLFVEELISKIIELKQIKITRIECSGKVNSRSFKVIHTQASENPNAEFYLLLYNCGNDKQVKSDIRDQLEGLKKAGYTKIIGIRDVYPDASLKELEEFRAGLKTGFVTDGLLSIVFCLGVMEFEAWLLAEHSHFERIHEKITTARIMEELEINLLDYDYSSISQPAKVLQDIYWLEKIPYDKSQATVKKILSAIDFEQVRINVSDKFIDLKNLYQVLNEFFEIS